MSYLIFISLRLVEQFVAHSCKYFTFGFGAEEELSEGTDIKGKGKKSNYVKKHSLYLL